MYYVRKLDKPANLFKFQEITHIADTPADLIGQEMRTKSNTLSVWRCSDITGEELNNAITAALFASSSIAATQFIIFDSAMFARVGIEVVDVEGTTSYKGLNKLHSDICGLTYEKLGKLIELHRESSTNAKLTPKIEKITFQAMVRSAYQHDQIDFDSINEHLKSDIDRLMKKT